MSTKNSFSRFLSLILVAAFVFLSAPATVVKANETDSVTLTILATTDLHGKIHPWEYATDSPREWGLAKIATLVNQQRALNPNTILIDNGDTIEANMISLFNDDAVHPMIRVMNALSYDVWNIGNHEFNFGLDVLGRAIENFNGATLSANIRRDDGSYFVEPYTVLEVGGVRVGIFGLIAPHVPRWEAGTPENFEGLDFLDPLERAQYYVSHLRMRENVDVVIGAFHFGQTSENYNPAIVDGAREIAERVSGIDALVLGHSHSTIGHADNQMFFGDTIVVQPAADGTLLGKITLELTAGEHGFTITDKSTELLSTNGVEPDAGIITLTQYVDDRSRAEVYSVVGRATGDFVQPDTVKGIVEAQVASNALIDLINRVQLFYTDADVSAAALFDSRSNLLEGELRFMDVALIYRYSNTLQAHRISGANLRAYMEWSASYYNTQVEGDVTISFNENIRAYNYDMFLGVDYDIDIRKPAGERIVNLTFNGSPLNDDDEFVLALNNYRAGTLQSLGLLPDDLNESMVFDSTATPVPEMQRLIQQYIAEELGGIVEPTVANNWRVLRNDYSHLEGAAEAIALINAGVIELPRSEDGRTPNVRSINVLAPATAEYAVELAAAAGVDARLVTHTELTGGLYRQIYELFKAAEPEVAVTAETALEVTEETAVTAETPAAASAPVLTAPATTSARAQLGNTAVVANCWVLNVRAAASIEAAIIGWLNADEVVTVISEGNFGWVEVTNENASGWVYGGFLE